MLKKIWAFIAEDSVPTGEALRLILGLAWVALFIGVGLGLVLRFFPGLELIVTPLLIVGGILLHAVLEIRRQNAKHRALAREERYFEKDH